jgi:hypothetical protein
VVGGSLLPTGESPFAREEGFDFLECSLIEIWKSAKDFL